MEPSHFKYVSFTTCTVPCNKGPAEGWHVNILYMLEHKPVDNKECESLFCKTLAVQKVEYLKILVGRRVMVVLHQSPYTFLVYAIR